MQQGLDRSAMRVRRCVPLLPCGGMPADGRQVSLLALKEATLPPCADASRAEPSRADRSRCDPSLPTANEPAARQ